MPRPTKQTVDYFPHYVSESKTKFTLENRWGNDGYAFWFKLLELICKTDGHAYSLKDPLDWEYFISVMKVNDDIATAIISKLVEIGKIDRELWEIDKTIWCPTLMEHIKFVYDKRTVAIPQKPIVSKQKGVSAPKTDITATETGVFGDDNPQSKPNEIKENEIISPPVSPPASQGDENPKKKPAEKKVFGSEFQNVRLTDDEYGKLVERMGKDSAADYIDRLDCWLENGHKKKSHYATILNWYRTDHPKPSTKGSGNNGTTFKPSRT